MKTNIKCGRLKLILIVVVFIIFLLPSCKQKIDPIVSNSELRYNPFGENVFVSNCATYDNTNLYTLDFKGNVYRTSGQDLKPIWKTGIDANGKEIIACKNGSVIIIKSSPFSWDEITYCRIDEERIMSFNSSGQKLMPKYPNANEHLISAISDGNNGAYLLITLQQMGSNIYDTKAEDVYLVHINDENMVEARLRLDNYFVKLASDKNGNLFGMTYKGNSHLTTGTSPKDSFMIVSFNKASLKHILYL